MSEEVHSGGDTLKNPSFLAVVFVVRTARSHMVSLSKTNNNHGVFDWLQPENYSFRVLSKVVFRPRSLRPISGQLFCAAFVKFRILCHCRCCKLLKVVCGGVLCSLFFSSFFSFLILFLPLFLTTYIGNQKHTILVACFYQATLCRVHENNVILFPLRCCFSAEYTRTAPPPSLHPPP